MTDQEKQGRIEFTLPMSKKSAYVRAARAQGKKLVQWMTDTLDAQVPGEDSAQDAKSLYASLVQQASAQQYLQADDARYFSGPYPVESQHIRVRILVERAIVRKLVSDVLAFPGGVQYCVSVFDGEQYAIEHSRDVSAIMDCIGAADEEYLRVYPVLEDGTYGKCVLVVVLVYGNDGYDVIADRNDTELAQQLCKGAEDLADDLCDHIHM